MESCVIFTRLSSNADIDKACPKFWSSIRPKRCAHSDEKPSEADYPVNFGILLSAPFFHMPLPYGKKVF